MKNTLLLTTFILLLTSNTFIIAQNNAINEGVEINGVIWATRNIGMPNTFADNIEDAGMFYQWNRKIAWQSVDIVTDWDSSLPIGSTWEKDNDPSPTGWRIPTFSDIQKLLDNNKVNRTYAIENGVSGTWFIDKTSNKSIFLPAAGSRSHSEGVLCLVGSVGDYWSVTQGAVNCAYYLFFNNSGLADCLNSGYRALGYSIRCVKEDAPITSLINAGSEEIKIYTQPNTIIIENVTGKVSIHNTAGQLIARRAEACHGSIITVPTAGIYIVRVDNHIQKAIVP